MPNPWTGKGNPYTRKEVIERLRATLKKGNAIIAGGAGTGISAKFIERGGADLIVIYNSGRFRMMGHGSTAGMMAMSLILGAPLVIAQRRALWLSGGLRAAAGLGSLGMGLALLWQTGVAGGLFG